MAYFKKNQIENLQNFFDEMSLEKLENQDFEIALEYARKIVAFFRPKNPINSSFVSIEQLLHCIENNPINLLKLKLIFNLLFENKKLYPIFSDSGILKDTDFFSEIKRRLYAKILPYQAQKNTLEFVLNNLIYRASDPIWILKIPQNEIAKATSFLNITSIYESVAKNSVLHEMLLSMSLLGQRMSGRALEEDVIKMVPEYEKLENPFAALEKELKNIENLILSQNNQHYIHSSNDNYRQVFVLHKQCEEFVDKAFFNAKKYGISLKVNQNLLRIKQQLHRFKVLLPFLAINNEDEKLKNSLAIAFKLIKYNCLKNNISKLINESTQLISYEITQHTAKTGEKYITDSKKEYYKMFIAALGGGLIVGFLCLFKILLSKIETSAFGHAFWYSINYAFGFITIYLLSFTLATKQPAMTAAALVKALEEGMKKTGNALEKHKEFAFLFARVFRSQFIAFLGNVIMAFPIAYFLIWLIDVLFDYNIANSKWQTLLQDLSPIDSPAIFHAGIAGLFLFLSGIISGSIANRDKHYQVYYRIQEHPWLKRTFGKEKTKKIAKLYEKKWAGIMSNFWFGIFMGSTASVGLFFGLNLDIRHITFASGNLALGWYGSEYTASNSTIFWAIFGIAIIGLVNFLVSFLLSLFLAFRSRNIPLFEVKEVFVSIKVLFRKKPLLFFFPITIAEKRE